MTPARTHASNAYDAACPGAAWRRGDGLATLDRDLANPAAAEGVVPIHRDTRLRRRGGKRLNGSGLSLRLDLDAGLSSPISLVSYALRRLIVHTPGSGMPPSEANRPGRVISNSLRTLARDLMRCHMDAYEET